MANNIGSANSPILIQSAGGGSPTFHSMTIEDSQYIAITGMDVDTSHMTNRAYWEDDLRVENSNNIEIVNNDFTGHAQGYLSEGSASTPATGVQGHSAAYIIDSQDIIISDNTFQNHFNTFRAEDIQNLVFDGNEVTAFQGDGFHAGGLQNAQITNNHMHTPLGSTQTITHSDFIHIRALNADLTNDGIEIANNVIDSASGWGAQGIHIRNTQFGTGNQWDGYLKNISIHDNVIHTSLPRGIGVDDIQGLEVYNNTVLWNASSQIQTTPDSTPISWDARILVYNSPGANVSDNIASYIRTDGTLNPNGGYMIDYNDPNAANYVGKHFVNVDGSGDSNSYDLNLLSSSSLFGSAGAAMSSGGTATATGTLSVSGSSTTTAAPVVQQTTSNDTSDTSNDTSTTTASGSDDTSTAPVVTSTDTSAPAPATTSSSAPADDADVQSPVLVSTYVDTPTVINGDDTTTVAPDDTTADTSAAPATTSTAADDDTSAPAPVVLSNFANTPTVINDDITTVAPDTTSSAADTSGSGDDTSAAPVADPMATADVADTSGDDTSAGDASDDTSGYGIPKGQHKKAAKQEADDDDGNILTKFFSMIFGGDDEDDAAVETGANSSNGFGRGGSKKADQSLDDVVPITEWISDTGSVSDTSEDDDDDDDTMIAA